MKIRNGADLLALCDEENLSLHQLMLLYESDKTGKTPEEIKGTMAVNLQVMKRSAYQGLEEDAAFAGKIIGGQGKKMRQRYETVQPVCGATMARAVSFALSVTEVNASMGRIVAAPTAGSCGVLPGVLFSLAESHQIGDEQLVEGLFTAGTIGLVIAKNASLSGAEGGCQAEVGSASAMGAGAAVEIMGGSPAQALHAGAIALKNLLGLVCDPIAGLVEAPCSKRNAVGTANALVAAEMALAGIESIIPFDEVVEAMHQVGRAMPCALRETAEGGLAATPTGQRLKLEIFHKPMN
ncbi:L-serine ammonia-lyase, iron-sulfur-dependent, subunit alpha [Dehalobacterium formicoaceticum]|uniref:L-serine ammonia-lyase, iron-sulfur-dependent, subunit alpha n=1 Tax=Dehalobacterium formicoaceticum TaxID=51515 RepID=UPI000B7DAB72|nr:L-serine ammonia-lyase, iron-sulfur-dependent, subunit alpha [Dehalobacterium formicoaceticum]